MFQQSDQLIALLAVESHALSGNRTVLLAGKYRLTVRFRADEVESVDGVFLVQTSMWSDLDVSLED